MAPVAPSESAGSERERGPHQFGRAGTGTRLPRPPPVEEVAPPPAEEDYGRQIRGDPDGAAFLSPQAQNALFEEDFRQQQAARQAVEMEGYSNNPADYYGLWTPGSNENPADYFRPKADSERRLQELLSAPSQNPADYWVPPEDAAAASSHDQAPDPPSMSRSKSSGGLSKDLQPAHLPRPSQGSGSLDLDRPNVLRTQDLGLGRVAEQSTVASMTMERPEAASTAATDSGEKPPRPGSVATLSIDIQRGFRIKMFTILLVQQVLTVVLSTMLLVIHDARDVRPLSAPLRPAALGVSRAAPVYSHP